MGTRQEINAIECSRLLSDDPYAEFPAHGDTSRLIHDI